MYKADFFFNSHSGIYIGIVFDIGQTLNPETCQRRIILMFFILDNTVVEASKICRQITYAYKIIQTHVFAACDFCLSPVKNIQLLLFVFNISRMFKHNIWGSTFHFVCKWVFKTHYFDRQVLLFMIYFPWQCAWYEIILFPVSNNPSILISLL